MTSSIIQQAISVALEDTLTAVRDAQVAADAAMQDGGRVVPLYGNKSIAWRAFIQERHYKLFIRLLAEGHIDQEMLEAYSLSLTPYQEEGQAHGSNAHS